MQEGDDVLFPPLKCVHSLVNAEITRTVESGNSSFQPSDESIPDRRINLSEDNWSWDGCVLFYTVRARQRHPQHPGANSPSSFMSARRTKDCFQLQDFSPRKQFPWRKEMRVEERQTQEGNKRAQIWAYNSLHSCSCFPSNLTKQMKADENTAAAIACPCYLSRSFAEFRGTARAVAE